MGKIGDYNQKIQVTMYIINRQQGSLLVQHRDIDPLFCKNFKWSISCKTTEPLCCTSKTNIIF